MKKLLVATLLLTMITPCLQAQKKELSQARSYIKSGKYSEAEKLMTALLKDSTNRDNKRIYATWFEAVHGLYLQGNEKLYLKQKYDTAVFFGHVKQMFTIAEHLDSLDMRPDSKGKVVMAYRHRNAELLNSLRTNLFNGGNFFLRKSKWKEAFDYLETYIDTQRQPLFEAYDYANEDKRLPEAGYWATYAGYKMHDAVLTLRHRHLALTDSVRGAYTLQYIAEARRWLNDDELYLSTLQEGFRRYPTSPYFFPRLTDFYTHQGQYEKALAVADSALAVNDSSQLYLFAKSSALLRLERYGECVKYSERLISINDSLAEPYFNAGTAYVYIAERYAGRKDRKLMKSNYQKARTYMEKYRAMKPEEHQKWAPVLYRIYLYLNMGKQFDEMDRILRGGK